MNFVNLTEENFLFYAIKNYTNPGCISKKEFNSDMDRVKYIKRLFKRYYRKKTIDSLRLRLVLNHIIIIYNVFEAQAATRILFYKLEKELWPILKTFLAFLNFLPDRVTGINSRDVTCSAIRLDPMVAIELKRL